MLWEHEDVGSNPTAPTNLFACQRDWESGIRLGRMKHRTPAYWTTRIMLAIGIAAVLFAGVALLMEPATMGGGRRMAENPFVLAAFLVMVVGLVWMVRIFRGPRDEPPAWRHRDR